MTIRTISVTTMNCDGSHGQACPDSSTLVHEYPQMIAIRLARKNGWLVGIETICPGCATTAPSSPGATTPLPIIPAVRRPEGLACVPAGRRLVAG